MFFQMILTLLIVLGGLWAIWKFLIEPRLLVPEEEPEHLKILNEKLETASILREHLESVRQEKDVTSEIIDTDAEIEALLKEIAYMERKYD